MERILIVCRGFYPQNSPRSFRATELAKEFAKQGHNVTVITPKDNPVHEQFACEHKIEIKNLGSLSWKPLKSGQSKMLRLITRGLNRFLLMAFEYPNVELLFKVPKALKEEQGYDLLISIAVPYPIHWGVALVWKKNQKIAKTWVADCGDPFMGNQTDSFRKWFYFKYVEKWFMRKTDFISIPIETARSAYYPEFHHKIKVIPQGFKIEAVVTQESPEWARVKIPTFAYAGGFIPGLRDPRPFLEYLHKQKADFRFIIYTNQIELVVSFQEKLKGKLIVKNYIAREELLKDLRSMDFLVNFDNNKGSARPSKLIDYAIVGRPVLNIKRDLDPNLIDQFLQGDYANRMRLPDLEIYRIENVCQAFLGLIKSGDD